MRKQRKETPNDGSFSSEALSEKIILKKTRSSPLIFSKQAEKGFVIRPLGVLK